MHVLYLFIGRKNGIQQAMKMVVARTLTFFLAVAINPLNHYHCQGFSATPKTTSATKSTCSISANDSPPSAPLPTTESFSVPLVTERPEPTTAGATLNRLWNDPRPVTSLIRDALDRIANPTTKISKVARSLT